MDIKVRFRFNKMTGDVEQFDVDQDEALPSREHHAEHDRLAADIGALLAQFPQISDIASGAPAAFSAVQEPLMAEDGEDEVTSEGAGKQKVRDP